MTYNIKESVEFVEWYRHVGHKHLTSHKISEELVDSALSYYGESVLLVSYQADIDINLVEWGLPTAKDNAELRLELPSLHQPICERIERINDECANLDGLLSSLSTIIGRDISADDLQAALSYKGGSLPAGFDDIWMALAWWHKGVDYNGDALFANQSQAIAAQWFACVHGVRKSARCSQFVSDNLELICDWMCDVLDYTEFDCWADYMYQFFPPMRKLKVDIERVSDTLRKNDMTAEYYGEVAEGIVQSILWVIATGLVAHKPIKANQT